MKEMKFVGRIWHSSDGALTDRFLNWLFKKKMNSGFVGKQCEIIIKLKHPTKIKEVKKK